MISYDLELLGIVLDALMKIGRNSVVEIGFNIADDESTKRRALDLAVGKGRRRAERLAHATRVVLGKLVEISEVSVSKPPLPSVDCYGGCAAAI